MPGGQEVPLQAISVVFTCDPCALTQEELAGFEKCALAGILAEEHHLLERHYTHCDQSESEKMSRV